MDRMSSEEEATGSEDESLEEFSQEFDMLFKF